MTSLEKDTLSRNRIVSGINENFFVEAGAGTGKTTMLVNRMAAMVEAGLDISKICAITFTKAAAGEFYDRHSYFLIDEFQDTNPMQAEVFFYLSAEHPVPQWSACVPRPGSLFIVGDPKQSIYRFRSADVTSFLKVKSLFEKNGGSYSKGRLCADQWSSPGYSGDPSRSR